MIGVAVLLLFHGGLACAATVKEVDPSKPSKGKICAWKSKGGVEFQYWVPRSYRPEEGANLTFILHGSNLTKGWGFANHKAGEFRPDDIVVSPNGTTANGNGGYNFIGKESDVEAFDSLRKELTNLFKVNATFLYGHSQGSFFALHYAGAKPESVQGVVAHASGLWTWSKRSKAAHHQAIVLMHGTQDPVVSYGQSRGGLEAYREMNYPTVRMRSLEGWNHWPAEHNGPVPHVSQQLAWAEGMTSLDERRLGVVFKILGKPRSKETHDFAALDQVARRIQQLPTASAGAKKAADRAIKGVEALITKHVASLRGAKPESGLEDGAAAWVGHLPLILRAFEGVPAAEKCRKEWEAVLKKQADASTKHLGLYYKELRAGNKKNAFLAGVEALSNAFLVVYVGDRDFLKSMNSLADEGKGLAIDKEELKRFKSLMANFRKSKAAGKKAFDSLNRKAAL